MVLEVSMRRCRLILAVLGCLVPAVPAFSDEVVALYPLRGLGVDASTVASLQSIVHHELNRVPGMSLVDADQTRRYVEEQKLDCQGRDGCLAAFGKNLGATVAVDGVVGGLGDMYTIALKAVGTETEEIRDRVQLRVGGERETLIDGVRAGAYQLLRPDLYVGSLQIELPVEGARIYVDGRMVGTTPFTELITGLEPGQRALKIVKTGFRDFDRFIEVRFQRTSVVTIDLEQSVVADVFYEEAPLDEALAQSPSTEDSPQSRETLEADGLQDADAISPVSTVKSDPSLRAMRKGSYALLGAGGLALLAGGSQGLLAWRREVALTERFDEQEGPTVEDVNDWNRAHSTASRANALYFAGGAIGAAGLALLVSDIVVTRASGQEQAETTVSMRAYLEGPGVLLSITW